MEFKQKIDKILKIRGLALWKLAELSELNSTLEKAYAENREMRKSTTAKFLQKLGINPDWWERQEGDVFDNEAAKDVPTNDETALSLAAKAIAALERQLDLADLHEKDSVTRLERDKDRMTDDKSQLYSIIERLTLAIGNTPAKQTQK